MIDAIFFCFNGIVFLSGEKGTKLYFVKFQVIGLLCLGNVFFGSKLPSKTVHVMLLLRSAGEKRT